MSLRKWTKKVAHLAKSACEEEVWAVNNCNTVDDVIPTPHLGSTTIRQQLQRANETLEIPLKRHV
jgi:hypothetical protein